MRHSGTRTISGLIKTCAVAVLCGGFGLGMAASASFAKPRVTTAYKYYSITGKSSRELYQQMVARGPQVSGAKAFATTSRRIKISKFTLSVRNGCRVKRFSQGLKFVITLPRLRHSKTLRRAELRRWRAFAAFVKRHELRHRAIWIKCASDFERQVRRIRSKSCKATASRMVRIFKQVEARCERRHDAFDLAEQKRLARHPLVAAAKKIPPLHRVSSTTSISKRSFLGAANR